MAQRKLKKKEKRQKKLGKNTDDFAHLKDNVGSHVNTRGRFIISYVVQVSFGDVVQAPPSIGALPRNATKHDTTKPNVWTATVFMRSD